MTTWHAHHGGPMPTEALNPVHVRWRREVRKRLPDHEAMIPAGWLDWRQVGSDTDIVAWRLPE